MTVTDTFTDHNSGASASALLGAAMQADAWWWQINLSRWRAAVNL